jgi:tetratricopeptide (TPR) repeat protein
MPARPNIALAGLLFLVLSAPSFARAPGEVYTPDQLRSLLRGRLDPTEFARLQIPFEAGPEILAAAARITRSAKDDRQKLEHLRAHFRRHGYLERYDRDGTRTAQEVMDSGQGNCLSYANLFVAMARAVGLQAFYLDASHASGGERGKSGSLLVEYGHVLVGVRLGPELVAVEFDGRTRRAGRYAPLSDLEAVADFYNNRGFERSWSQPERGGIASEEALADFRLATLIAPGLSRSWNNLGVALARLERLIEAEQAYRQAIRTAPESAAAHANLGQLWLRRGAPVQAVEALTRAVEFAPRNAHYRVFLARALLALGREPEARLELEQAAGADPGWFVPHLELMRLHERRGELAAARDASREVLLRAPGQRDALQLLDP